MCHAPIVLPEIAAENAARVRRSTEAMAQAASRALGARPDAVVIVSPHTPRHRRAFGVAQAARLHGDFGQFGFPEIRIDLPGAQAEAGAVLAKARADGLEVAPLPDLELDHGAMVPLFFLQEAGWNGPTLLLSLPMGTDLTKCRRLGEAVAAAAREAGRNWVFVASGDMSHRLIRDAPAGFHPRAREFDSHVASSVKDGRYEAALAVDEDLRDLAAEDVIDSLAVAVGAIGNDPSTRQYLSYEGPFGVGYLVAVLHEGRG